MGVRGGRVTVKISGGSSPAPPKLCASWLTKCGSNNALGDAVTLLGGAGDWYDLYKVWEVLKSKIGKKAIVDKGWASNKELGRLTQTINHYRHYRKELPSDPPSYEDARRQIVELVRKALDE